MHRMFSGKPIIGIAGGIGSGKSLIAQLFGEGDWYRVNGKWERHRFTATSFIPLEKHSLHDALREMGQLFSGIDPDDLASTVAELRGA